MCPKQGESSDDLTRSLKLDFLGLPWGGGVILSEVVSYYLSIHFWGVRGEWQARPAAREARKGVPPVLVCPFTLTQLFTVPHLSKRTIGTLFLCIKLNFGF